MKMKTPYVFAAVHGVTGSVIGWAAIVTVLVTGHASLGIILSCIVASFVVALPVAYLIVKRMTGES